jgi:hypothetical protein
VPSPRCLGCRSPIHAKRQRANGTFPRYCEKPACRVKAFYERAKKTGKAPDYHAATREADRARERREKRVAALKPRACLGRPCGGREFVPVDDRQKYCEVCRVIPWPKRRTRKRMRRTRKRAA